MTTDAIVVMMAGQSAALGPDEYLRIVHRAITVECIGPGCYEVTVPSEMLVELRRDPAISYVRPVLNFVEFPGQVG